MLLRRSGNKEHKAAHIETAFLSDLELVLGQMATEEKSNELTAIPKLLEILALTKCTVTIDAMGTHRDIAEAIHDKGADYILPVKENQPPLLDDIKLYAESDVLPQDKDVLKQAYRYAEVNEKGHGRIEKRECWLFDDAEWLKERHDWPFLHGVAVIRSTRTMLDTGEVSSVNIEFQLCKRLI
ncbi:MAG: ISAs1 family transposase [Clostridia bacterium]|nr:ISAs1 family transposase [Clostridia bacterium]